MGKLNPLGGWYGFTWDRIYFMLEIAFSALSVQHNDYFDFDNDDADDVILHGSPEGKVKI